MPLKVTISEKKEGVVMVSLVGELDTSTYADFDRHIAPVLASHPDIMVLDMEYLDYISSIGVSSILKAKKTLKKHGGTLQFLKVQPQIKKVFDIINALPSQRIFATVEELDLYLDRMQQAVKEEAEGS